MHNDLINNKEKEVYISSWYRINTNEIEKRKRRKKNSKYQKP